MEEDLVELLKREPFTPFAVILVNGNRYQVDSSELAVSDDTCLNIYYVRPYERNTIRLEHISVIEIRETSV
jgi:hypothetical protein